MMGMIKVVMKTNNFKYNIDLNISLDREDGMKIPRTRHTIDMLHQEIDEIEHVMQDTVSRSIRDLRLQLELEGRR